MENFIDKLRSIEWSRSYKWEVEFTSPPPSSPFDKFFPAETINLPFANVRTDIVVGPIESYEVPDGADAESLSITFYDDEQFTLATYFKKWMKDIIENGEFIRSLEHSCRIVHFRKLNSMDKIILAKAYQVFPRGELVFSGNTASEVTTFSLDFVIAGEVNA